MKNKGLFDPAHTFFYPTVMTQPYLESLELDYSIMNAGILTENGVKIRMVVYFRL